MKKALRRLTADIADPAWINSWKKRLQLPGLPASRDEPTLLLCRDRKRDTPEVRGFDRDFPAAAEAHARLHAFESR